VVTVVVAQSNKAARRLSEATVCVVVDAFLFTRK